MSWIKGSISDLELGEKVITTQVSCHKACPGATTQEHYMLCKDYGIHRYKSSLSKPGLGQGHQDTNN